MLRHWLRQARREFERGFLGKGRPRVGSRRRDRLPRAMVTSATTTRHAPVAPQTRAAAEPVRAATPPSSPAQHRPVGLAFVVVLVVLALGLVYGFSWATGAGGGPLSQALGITAAVSPAGGGTPAPAASSVVPTAAPAAPTPQPRTYQVQPGDTLLKIAEEHGTTVEALVEANDLDNPELLTVGSRLVIPEA